MSDTAIGLLSFIGPMFALLVFALGGRQGAHDAILGIATENKYWLNRLEVEKLKVYLESESESR